MTQEIIWGAVGLLLIIADVVFGTFFMLFLGAGALITAGLTWAGILPDPTYQWLVFGGTSVLGVLLFRKKLLQAFGPGSNEKYNEHTGQQVEVTEDIPLKGTGKVKYRGTEWLARSHDGKVIPAGEKVMITGNDGIILEVSDL